MNKTAHKAALVASAVSLKISTREAPGYIDITEEVARFVAEAGVFEGLVVVFSLHTTAAIKINEKEPLLMQDITSFLEQLAPRNSCYRHNEFSIRTVNMSQDECPNGHAHCLHWLLGTSEIIPIVSGQMMLGQWQRIFLVELDRPREREVVLQAFGLGGQP
ncbi:MAG: secondary thiamine-phosphate synthase enzyme YjbQ [Chloroflexota bacterium]|nr:secondary thiamine-phosphate synthase enzyme YjbQ [Chloroflexota bacterium]